LKIHFANDRSVADIFELVVERSGSAAIIFGMGNIGGMGLELVRFFRNRSKVALPAGAI
jgi:hypothetical protein